MATSWPVPQETLRCRLATFALAGSPQCSLRWIWHFPRAPHVHSTLNRGSNVAEIRRCAHAHEQGTQFVYTTVASDGTAKLFERATLGVAYPALRSPSRLRRRSQRRRPTREGAGGISGLVSLSRGRIFREPLESLVERCSIARDNVSRSLSGYQRTEFQVIVRTAEYDHRGQAGICVFVFSQGNRGKAFRVDA